MESDGGRCHRTLSNRRRHPAPASGDVDVAGIATLVAAEQDCCRFFTFTLIVGVDGVVLDIVGPDDAQPVIGALIGAAS
ncbi:MAG: hypothetical protein M5T61_20230 [Acidimicrobiia bacterium]|nr:hypothetical protein [Acidimicrobiia bacterium]